MSPNIATPRARALGFSLRAAREERRIGLRELARLAHLSAGHLHNWETGMRIPKESEVGVLAGCLRLTIEERDRLVDLARNAREPNWLNRTDAGLAACVTYAEYERTAKAIFNWQPSLFPGLLQIGEYARAVMDSDRVSEDELDVRVLIRVARRELLRGPVEFTALVGATALHTEVGGRSTMIAQLRHLTQFAKRRNVVLRIVPEHAAYHRGLLGNFVILDFSAMPSIVHAEQALGGTYSSAPEELALHRTIARELMSLALDEDETLALIEATLVGLTRTC